MNARHGSARSRSALCSALVTLVGVVCPAMARAQGDSEAAETAAARTLAIDGVKLAQNDKCDEALEKLDRAERLKHSAIVLGHLGECQVKVGRWVEGSESLRKLLREPLPESPSPTLTQVYESAAATLRDVRPRIPSMKIILNAPVNVDFTIKVDGKELADSVVGVALPSDPGEHTVEATAPGFLKASTSVKLTPNSAAMVTLELARDPHARLPAQLPPASKAEPRATASTRTTEADKPAPAPHGTSAGKVLGYVSYAVAAAGLGVGIAFGQSAMQDEKSLRASCPGRVCTPAQESALDFAKTKGTVATIGFAVAGGGAALGTVLLLTSSSAGSSEAARSRTPSRTASLISRPRALLGVGSIAVAGDF
jgi:hypothetical protein